VKSFNELNEVEAKLNCGVVEVWKVWKSLSKTLMHIMCTSLYMFVCVEMCRCCDRFAFGLLETNGERLRVKPELLSYFKYTLSK